MTLPRPRSLSWLRRAARRDDLVGGTVRTVGLPVRVVAPVALVALRVARQRMWVERTTTVPAPPTAVDWLARTAGNSQSARRTVADDDGGGDDDVVALDDAVGPAYRRRYSVTISGSDLTASELITRFRDDPNRFSPQSFAPFSPPSPGAQMRPGQEYEVMLPGPWDGPVTIADAPDGAVRFVTRDGHLERGAIEFRADDDGDRLEFTIESMAASADVAVHALYRWLRIARLVQTEMWVRVLEAAVDVSGGVQDGPIRIDTTEYLEGAP